MGYILVEGGGVPAGQCEIGREGDMDHHPLWGNLGALGAQVDSGG